MSKEISILEGSFTVTLDDDGNGGTITSNQHEDIIVVGIEVEEYEEIMQYNNRLEGIESLILGHACAGIDITTDAYQEGVKTALDGCANN